MGQPRRKENSGSYPWVEKGAVRAGKRPWGSSLTFIHQVGELKTQGGGIDLIKVTGEKITLPHLPSLPLIVLEVFCPGLFQGGSKFPQVGKSA